MGDTVTYFQNLEDTLKPHYLSVEAALERIKAGKIKDQVLKLRSITDTSEKRKYKNSLPCICFSGRFNKRNDKDIVSHSGYAILDFDHVDPEDYKKKIRPYPWVKAAFVSPSGDGLKVLAKIPADTANHSGYYQGLVDELSWMKGLDLTSKNVSRICFESYDPEIYINPSPEEFTKKKEVKNIITVSPLELPPNVGLESLQPELIDRCVNMILQSINGQKHATLLAASRLAGGYIAGGKIIESEAWSALEAAIQTLEIEDLDGAKKTIKDGINYGKAAPLNGAKPKAAFHSEQKVKVDLNDDDFSFISTSNNEQEYLTACKDGTLKMGLSTGFSELDKNFRFKLGNLVIVNGHDNVGKSSVLWHFAMISNYLHNWKWIIFSAENSEGQVRKNLIQYRWCKEIKEFNSSEYQRALKWAYDNFTIIRTVDVITCEELLKMAQKVHSKNPHQAFLIDPYNALDIDIEHTKLSSHEYHYKVTSQLRAFCKRNQICIYLNTHAVTEALRKVHKEGDFAGYPMAPNKADTEGGGKFSNRADDFLTIHRYPQHPSLFNVTEIHVRKIKETETGGRPTMRDFPFCMRMAPKGLGFRELNNDYTPLLDYNAKIQNLKDSQSKIPDELNDLPPF